MTLRNLLNQVDWDLAQPPGTYPTAIDTWVLNHGVALVVKRVDGIEVHDLTAFSRFAGVLLTDSPDTSQNPRCGFGIASDNDFDTVVYGVIATASNS